MTDLTALHPPMIAAGLAAVLTVLQMGFMAQTGLARGRRNVVLGLGEDREIQRLARRHGNLAENAALLVAGIALAEMIGAPTLLVQIAAGIALAGIGRKGVLAEMQALPHPYACTVFTNDAIGACLGAHSGRDGAIVITGTGSVGIGFVDGKELRIGGYGFPLSDEGSGAYLGLNALQDALRAHDGRMAATPLLDEIMGRFHNDPIEAVAWMDQATASDYATFAPTVLRHADQGDAAGRQIVQSAASHIDTFVRTLFAQRAPRVSLLGGLSSAIEPWLSPDVRRALRPADGDAVSGAIILAKRSV